MIITKPNCAYCRDVELKLFLNELWPLEFFIHITYMDISCDYLSATLGHNFI